MKPIPRFPHRAIHTVCIFHFTPPRVYFCQEKSPLPSPFLFHYVTVLFVHSNFANPLEIRFANGICNNTVCEISVIFLLMVSTSPDKCDKFISGMKFTGSLPEPVSGILFDHILRYSTDFPCRDTLFLFHNKEDTVWQTNYSSGSRLSVRGNR